MVLKKSLSMRGKRAANEVDMTARPWGDLKALRPGGNPYWWFECSNGHTELLHGQHVRTVAKTIESHDGVEKPRGYVRCPKCKELGLCPAVTPAKFGT